MKVSYAIPTAKTIIQHSLTNSQCATQTLEQLLADRNLSNYTFSSKVRMGYYNFDFYSEDLRLAIEIDSYINAHTGVPNGDSTKKLFVASLGIHVLRFTDYQILTDCDEIIRLIKQHITQKQLLNAS